MGRYFGLTLNMIGLAPAKVKKPARSWKRNPVRLGGWIFALLVVFGVLYIFQANSLSTKGYEIKQLEQQQAELLEALKRLELEASELKSIESIETQMKTLNMVPVSGVNYVRDRDYAYQP